MTINKELADDYVCNTQGVVKAPLVPQKTLKIGMRMMKSRIQMPSLKVRR
jgi:hypothetical protein